MRKAFTLIELLVVIAIIAVLVTILVPVVMTGLGKSETTVCQNNLGVIGRKHNDYANESETYSEPFPRHVDTGDANDEADLTPTNTLDVSIGACGMQTVWVMIDRGDLTDTAFRCPGDGDWVSRTSTFKYGWELLTEFSYGIHYPYSADGAGTDNEADPGGRESTTAARLVYRENLVLFADRNPGGLVGASLDHSNHAGTDGGTIIVSRVGNTKFHTRPEGAPNPNATAGFGDDIYIDAEEAAVPASGDGIPDNITDTVITPESSR